MHFSDTKNFLRKNLYISSNIKRQSRILIVGPKRMLGACNNVLKILFFKNLFCNFNELEAFQKNI